MQPQRLNPKDQLADCLEVAPLCGLLFFELVELLSKALNLFLIHLKQRDRRLMLSRQILRGLEGLTELHDLQTSFLDLFSQFFL